MDELYEENLSLTLNASGDVPYLSMLSENLASVSFGNVCRVYKIVEKNDSQYAVHKLTILSSKSKQKISCRAVLLDNIVYTVLGEKRIVSWSLLDESSFESVGTESLVPTKVFDSCEEKLFTLCALKDSLLIVSSNGNLTFLLDPETSVNPLNSEIGVEILKFEICEVSNDNSVTSVYFVIAYKSAVSPKKVDEKNTRLAILRMDDLTNLKDLKVIVSVSLKDEVTQICLPKKFGSKFKRALNVAVSFVNGHTECYDVITGFKAATFPFMVKSCPSHHYYMCEFKAKTFLYYESINHVLKEFDFGDSLIESNTNFSIIVQQRSDKVTIYSHDVISKRGCYISDLVKPARGSVVTEPEKTEEIDNECFKRNLQSIVEVLEGKISLPVMEKRFSIDDKSLIRMLRNLENHEVLKLFRQCSRTYISSDMPLGLRDFILRLCELILSANHDLLISHLSVDSDNASSNQSSSNFAANQRRANITTDQDSASFRKEFVDLCVKVSSECRRFDGLTDLLQTYDNLRELHDKSIKSQTDENFYVTYIEL